MPYFSLFNTALAMLRKLCQLHILYKVFSMYETVLSPLYMKNQQVKIMPSPIKNPWNALLSLNNMYLN